MVSADDEGGLSIVDPTAFAAALALERDGNEKVTLPANFITLAMGLIILFDVCLSLQRLKQLSGHGTGV